MPRHADAEVITPFSPPLPRHDAAAADISPAAFIFFIIFATPSPFMFMRRFDADTRAPLFR